MRHTFVIVLSLFLLGPVLAQLPSSNIYLFDIKQESDSAFQFSAPRYLTHFNPKGYNNQPAFFSNSELYISAQMPQQAQPDLYLLDLSKKSKIRVTNTPEGEFSPSRMPDYYTFSAVRQEISGRDTFIRVWQFPTDRLTNGRPVFKYLTGIGYYNWINSNQLAVFVIGSPNQLAIADVNSDQVVPIADNVGRCFMKLPNGNLAYVQKNDFGAWYLMEYNLYRRDAEPRRLVNTLTNTEDFAVTPTGIFLMGKGSKIYKFDPRRDSDWIEIVDLRFYDIRNITRMTVSGDMKLAIVAD